MPKDFGLPTPQAQVSSDVQGVYAVNAFPIVPVNGQPIPVSQSGSWTVSSSGTATVTRATYASVSGSISGNGQNVALTNTTDCATFAVGISGTWVGTISFLGSVDNVTQFAMNAFTTPIAAAITTTTTNQNVWIPYPGCLYCAVQFTAYTSGTANIVIHGAGGTFPLR